MAIFESEYIGDLKILTKHPDSDAEIIITAAPDNGGTADYFSPTDLCAISLSNCAMVMLALYAQTHNIDIKGTKISTQKFMSAEPRKIAGIEVIFTMPPNNYSDKEKTIFERVAKTCPIHRTFGDGVDQKLTFVWS